MRELMMEAGGSISPSVWTEHTPEGRPSATQRAAVSALNALEMVFHAREFRLVDERFIKSVLRGLTDDSEAMIQLLSVYHSTSHDVRTWELTEKFFLEQRAAHLKKRTKP